MYLCQYLIVNRYHAVPIVLIEYQLELIFQLICPCLCQWNLSVINIVLNSLTWQSLKEQAFWLNEHLLNVFLCLKLVYIHNTNIQNQLPGKTFDGTYLFSEVKYFFHYMYFNCLFNDKHDNFFYIMKLVIIMYLSLSLFINVFCSANKESELS